ncbi:MAG: hypothetical protein MN733_10455 [Nitrososphaera sp.]|nr:hypothetical protein [Nitrososphaera sp.]
MTACDVDKLVDKDSVSLYGFGTVVSIQPDPLRDAWIVTKDGQYIATFSSFQAAKLAVAELT